MFLSINLTLILILVFVCIRYSLKVSVATTVILCAISIYSSNHLVDADTYLLRYKVLSYLPSAIFFVLLSIIQYETTRLKFIVEGQFERIQLMEGNSQELMERFNEAQKALEEMERRLLKDPGFHLRWTEACENILSSNSEDLWKSLALELQKICKVEALEIYQIQEDKEYQKVYCEFQDDSLSMTPPLDLLHDRDCITVKESQDLASYSCIGLISYRVDLSVKAPLIIALKKLHFLDLNRSNIVLMQELLKITSVRIVSQEKIP